MSQASNMGGCFLPGCVNGRNWSTIKHIFRPPQGMGQKWEEILKDVRKDTKFDQYNENHQVCGDHFEDRYINKTYFLVVEGDQVILESCFWIWTLTSHAIPTIFLKTPVKRKITACKETKEIKKPRNS